MRRIKGLVFVLALVLLAEGVFAAEFPKRKAGLWEITTVLEGDTVGQRIKQCIDDTTDEKMAKLARKMNKRPGVECVKDERKKLAGRYITETDCTFRGVRVRTQGILEGNFDSTYSGWTVMRYEPAIKGVSEQKMNITASWQGACNAWQKPGDMEMPDGSIMNIDDVLKQ